MADVEDVHWWWCARREILSDTIAKYLRADTASRRVLEVGCGTGGNLPMLERFGSVTGAESSEVALDFIRSRRGDRFRLVKHALPEPLHDCFDVVGMFDVLEHIHDDRAALRWVADRLKPGGIAVITVPACPFLWTEHDEAAHHHRRYTSTALRAIIPDELKIEHLTYFNVLLFPAVAAVRLGSQLLPRAWRPKGTHMGLPPVWLNSLLRRLFLLERHFIPSRRAGAGVSLLAVLRRRSA